MRFILVCSCGGPLQGFRWAELDSSTSQSFSIVISAHLVPSVATLFDFQIIYVDESKDASRPFIVVDLPSEKEARLIGSRAISVKSIWEYWGEGKNYDQVHQVVKASPHLYVSSPSTSYRSEVTF